MNPVKNGMLAGTALAVQRLSEQQHAPMIGKTNRFGDRVAEYLLIRLGLRKTVLARRVEPYVHQIAIGGTTNYEPAAYRCLASAKISSSERSLTPLRSPSSSRA